MRAKAAPALVRYGSTLNLPRILSLNTNDEGRKKMNLEEGHGIKVTTHLNP
nr:MAG TPA: hypothetical protein [Caudoviricetes sp.]